ncbi:MAG: NHL repeat-containing protein [Candidatus Aminicenantes bacterium]|nr:NHL repeat-containing protein [Candidatus Aminicenantes bacterium]
MKGRPPLRFIFILFLSLLYLSLSTPVSAQRSDLQGKLPPLKNVATKYFYVAGPMQLLDSWGSYGVKEDKLYKPTDMTVGPDGTVFICGGTLGDPFEMIRVQCLTREGKYLRWFGGYKSGWQEDHWLCCPSGVAVAPDGTIWVTQSIGKQISHFTPLGEYLGRFSTSGNAGEGYYHFPYHPAIDGKGDIYVVDGGNSLLLKFDTTSNSLWVWGEAEKKQGKVMGLFTCAVSSAADNSVFVGDFKMKKIFQIDPNGNLIKSWGNLGSQPGRFEDIEKISIGPDNSLYILDKNLDRIQRFDTNGNLLTKWGSQGTGKMQFQSARTIAVSPEGFVYVMDSQQNYAKVKVFSTKYYKPKGTLVKLKGRIKGAPLEEIPKLLARIECEDNSGSLFYTSARPSNAGIFIYRRLPKGTPYTIHILGYDTTRYECSPGEITGTAGEGTKALVFNLVKKSNSGVGVGPSYLHYFQ